MSSKRASPRALSILIPSLAAILGPAACGPIAEPEATNEAQSAATACAWDPVFGVKSCYQGDWWIEFSVKDSTTIALSVEVSGTPSPQIVDLPNRVPLGGGYVKFTGGPSAPVTAGTLIRLRATQSAAAGGKTANSAWFPYRKATPIVDCTACTPACAADTCGSDGCGGTCVCTTGAVCLSDKTCCHPNDNACGPDGCGGTHGPCPCTPACAGKQCGDDGCGGVCGTCGPGTTCSAGTCAGGCVASWSPFWQQTSYAGPWWAEIQVMGGGSLARTVSLQVVGGASYPLSYGYGRWAGGLDGVSSGTPVILRATDATGATAETAPFQYLVDKAPQTDPCKGTPSTSPTCRPLERGMVTFTMDDSYESQSVLAGPILAQYGFKATVYFITDPLELYGLLPSAQALAAGGHEVGSHSKSHPDLTTLGPQSLDDELRISKQFLLANVGSPVASFASPMGSYDAAVVAAIKPYFSSHRTVNPGLNFMGSDVYELNADGVYNTSSVSEVCAWLTETATYKGWRILVFHDFTSAATSSSSLLYPIANFDGILRCAQSTPGLSVVTTREGAAALACASP